ncbi:MAG TPA: Gfo/Idh/MocA family oxidoreductase [Candidatus Limnocylindrales bacterium]|nr:Gfo/Idh/MocA family oxidoreductase [Candidatus Limnocylindrales bacterium]
MTGVAVLGMGTWGRNLIRVFSDQADVVVCANRGDRDAHDWLRREYPRSRASSSAHDAIEDPAVEAVVIATPIATHASLATASLAAGKAVFVEKPLATTAAAARRVVDAADAAGHVLFVGHTFLFDAAFEALEVITRSDPVETIALSWLKQGTFTEPLVWNLLPHEVALASWLTGSTPSLSILDRAAGPTEVDRLRLRLDFGAVAPRGTIEIDRIHGSKTKRARVGLRSGAVLEWKDGELSRIEPSGEARLLVGRTEEALGREVAAFLAAVRTGRPDKSDGHFGAAVVEAIEPVAISLDTAPSVAGQPA